MSDLLGIKSFAISNAIYMILKHVERDGLIDEVAEAIDLTADQQLGGRSEKVQERLVTKVLLPLAAKLMEENNERFVQILEAAKHGFPLDGIERRHDYRGESKPRPTIQPGNRREKLSGFTDGVVEA